MCPYCNDFSDPKVEKPVKVEFLPNYSYVLYSKRLSNEQDFNSFIKQILLDYLNDKISYEGIELFSNQSFGKQISVIARCTKCDKPINEMQINYTYELFSVYYDLLMQMFLDLFKYKFHADGSFLIDNKESVGYITTFFFNKEDQEAKKLYKLINIQGLIPNEKGGPGEELLKEAIKSIAFGVLSDFIYDLLKDKIKIVKETIVQKAIEFKDKENEQKILYDLRDFMKNENVEWNEDIAVALIDEDANNLIQKYIDSIIGKDC